MSVNKTYAERMPGYYTDEELALWRFIRDQGGYWSAPELLVRFPHFGSGRALGGVLTRLFNNHCLARRKNPSELKKYGVISTCEVPMTETLEPTSGELA